MKLREDLTEEQKEEIAATVDNEGFWYSLSDGGYLKPEEVLADQEDIDKVNEAVKTLMEFDEVCPSF